IRTAQLLDQLIVSPAGGQRVLGSQGAGGDFKNRAGVVIQPPDETRHDLKDPARLLHELLDFFEMRPAAGAPELVHRWNIREFGSVTLAVQYPQRVFFGA